MSRMPTYRLRFPPARLALPVPLLGLLLSGCEGAQPGGRSETPSGSVALAAPSVGFTLPPESVHLGFGQVHEPALRVPSGAVIEAHTQEASAGQLSPESTTEQLRAMSFTRAYPLAGPVYVEGAEPGDVLAVTLHRLEMGEWGWVGSVPGFGLLTEDFYEPALTIFRLEAGATEVDLGAGRRLPLRPFLGAMGVAPPGEAALPALSAGVHGGHLANPDLVEGVTVYFPVLVEGALFSLGGGRAVQGEGEVAGSGLEVPLRVVFEVNVVRGEWAIVDPQYEGAQYYAVMGSGATLEEASMRATRSLVDYLAAEHAMARSQAYLLASLAADLRVSRAAGAPSVTVSLRLPKAAFLAPP